MSAPLLVAADAGGTKTAAVAARGAETFARVTGPGGAVQPGRALAAATAIADAARRALARAGALRADVLVVGAAGVGREPERGELASALRAERIAPRVEVVTDIELLRADAFADGAGVVLAAGTGSIALGRDAEGAARRAGGYGWRMSDEGSGYWIGRAALARLTEERDGRAAASGLGAAVLAAARAADFDALVRWGARASTAEVAALAPGVLGLAVAGDAAAVAIVDAAADALAALARAAALAPRAPALPVALAGGLLAPDLPLRERVRARLAALPAVEVRPEPPDALAGGLRLARALA